MTDPTLSSTNPSPPRETNDSSEVGGSNEKLQLPKNMDMLLQAIPVLRSSTSLSKPVEPVENTPPCSEPVSCENNPNEEPNDPTPRFEYEFSCLFDGSLCFVHLFDTSDVSACERLLHRPVRAEEITYSPTTGNGFIEDPPFKHTFIKQPYKQTWTTHADIKAGVEYENTVAKRQSKHQSAENILAELL